MILLMLRALKGEMAKIFPLRHRGKNVFLMLLCEKFYAARARLPALKEKKLVVLVT